MSKHVRPSMLWRSEATAGWVKIDECSSCGVRAFWMDCKSPCAYCGEANLKRETGQWVTDYKEYRWWIFRIKIPNRSYWMLRSEASDKLPAWKNPESPEFDARRVAKEQLGIKT